MYKIKLNYMKQSDLKYSCLIAVVYFGMNVNAQVTPKDSIKEKKIEEVVMIGYGSQKKINVTGSIGVVSAKDLADKPNPNAMSSVQGKVAGVQITNAGSPGASPRVNIRGISTLSGDPVFVVDGILTDDISYLNSQDIESISLLKDPSSLAIYGSKASKGAIIVTTKSGRGKTTFNFNSYIGAKKITNIPKMVNRDQYIQLYNEKLINDTGSSAGSINASQYPADTNWFNEIFKTSLISSNDISASGSTDKIKYYLSLGYLKDGGNLDAGQGINSGNDFKRFTSKVNLSYKLTDKLTVGTNISWSQMRTNNSKNPTLLAYNSAPLYSPFKADGGYNYETLVNIANPRAELDLFRSKQKEDRFLVNIWGEYNIIDNLKFKINYTQDNRDYSLYNYSAATNYTGKPALSKLEKVVYQGRNYVLDNQFTFQKQLGKHNIDALLGFSLQQDRYNAIYASANNVRFDGNDSSLYFINGGTDYFVYDGQKTDGLDDRAQKRELTGYYARANYNYDGRYLLSGSIRRDASSNFTVGRGHWFYAVSGGWVISNESFMKDQNIFDLLKVRGSWGSLGNPDVPRDYTSRVTNFIDGAYFGGIGYPSATINTIIDPNIKWEVIKGTDVGLEMAFLKNKLKIDAAYYTKDTNDAVYSIKQPSISGATNPLTTNAYSFNNKGFEFNMSYNNNISENIKFGVYGNLTTIKNQITSVRNNSFNETGPYLFGDTITRLEAGQPVGSYYGFQVVGIFQNQAQVDAAPAQNGKTVGGFQFADTDGNGVVDAADKTFLGSPVPKFTYGFGFNLNVYNFDFAIDFQGVFGNKIYNYNREQRYGNESWDLDFYNNRWHGEGTSNEYPMVTNNQAIIRPNSFYVEDGSYFRIRNIQLGYTIPNNLLESLKIQKMRLYVSAQNPWTSFKYNGFSPEILNGDRVQSGVDNNIYPLSAIYSIGFNLTF